MAVAVAAAVALVLQELVVLVIVVHFGVMEETEVLVVLVDQEVTLGMVEDPRSAFMLGVVQEQLLIVFLIQELPVPVGQDRMVELVLQEVQDQAERAMQDIVMVGLEVMEVLAVLAVTAVVDRMVQRVLAQQCKMPMELQ